ncbi:MAG: hypothetical protein LQ342_002844 [Letrouitia transgressa]|nr:MAG: hypothetical protein LQ342_002844 [Letrouitia transgressa]
MSTAADGANGAVDNPANANQEPNALTNGNRVRTWSRLELTEIDAYDRLGYTFSTFKKWTILSVIFVVQCSMNFNAAVYGNAVDNMAEHFDISLQTARVGQAVFLIAYAFGCELWAPWSEEFGRRPILQLSLGLVNIWQLPCALAPNFATIVVGRMLGGLSSAGGSVTLGMVADMWEPDDQQYAVAFIVLSSVGGSVLGPVFGAFSQKYLSWRWIFWLQLLFGLATQFLHWIAVPETRATILLDREAKRRRRAGQTKIFGPNELKEKRISVSEVLTIWYRPFEMFFCEPIVLCLSLLSGFSDALIFTFLESYSPVFKQWNFGTIALGMTFVPLLIGYFIAYFSFFPVIRRHRAIRKKNPDALSPEARLWWLLYIAPLETIGLFGFAWTSLGPPHVHWIAPLLFSTLIAIANVRGFLWSPTKHVQYQLEWPSLILGFLAFIVTIPIYIFYWKGPEVRARSKFAQTLACDRKILGERRRRSVIESLPAGPKQNADKETSEA